MLANLTRHLSRLVHQPLRSSAALLLVVGSIELAQYTPELFVGAHALSEVVRNLAYALIGALIFQWLIVDLPAKRLRRSTYEFHRMTFQLLLSPGPGLIHQYQHAANVLGLDLDIWSQSSVSKCARDVAAAVPNVFGQDRAGLVKTTVELGVPRALAELSPSVAYLDPEVAHALSTFPRQEGLTVLQVQPTPSGGIDPARDAHITWSLLEAARRLYSALLHTGAYDRTIFQVHVGDPPVNLSDDVLLASGDVVKTSA